MAKPGFLVLEDGAVYRGALFGAEARSYGEVVFNTSMTGYQEVLTDPSYAGQIVTMTCPQIGNYGVAAEDVESRGPQVAGFVIREASPIASNWRSTGTLREYLTEHGVVAITASKILRSTDESASRTFMPWTRPSSTVILSTDADRWTSPPRSRIRSVTTSNTCPKLPIG